MDGAAHELAVPLANISGRIVSMQFIHTDKNKHNLFYHSESIESTFYSMSLEDLNLTPKAKYF